MSEAAAANVAQRLAPQSNPPHWGASSETALLTDVLLSAPAHLAMIPCNAVTVANLAQGLLTCPIDAVRQHRAFAATLEQAGVRCHFVSPREGMPDLCFTRDSVLMTPWGLVQLRPSAPHRRDESSHVAAAALAFGVPPYARIEEGTVEGGDVCLLREGLVVIGHSGDRTNQAGAEALGALFEERGWEVIHTRFDPRYLHLDTIMAMVADDCAVVFPDALEGSLLARLGGLGIRLVAATAEEVRHLSANFVSLGGGRVLAARGSERLAAMLEKRGVEVIDVALDQFTRCGGGPHCLTMPLARLPAA
ncbi:MAG: arginine deiminase family protein [Pseudomonadota bacterium]|nr:arginine deiminase family protein [Pseudomonadota bacterium]